VPVLAALLIVFREVFEAGLIVIAENGL